MRCTWYVNLHFASIVRQESSTIIRTSYLFLSVHSESYLTPCSYAYQTRLSYELDASLNKIHEILYHRQDMLASFPGRALISMCCIH